MELNLSNLCQLINRNVPLLLLFIGIHDNSRGALLATNKLWSSLLLTKSGFCNCFFINGGFSTETRLVCF